MGTEIDLTYVYVGTITTRGSWQSTKLDNGNIAQTLGVVTLTPSFFYFRVEDESGFTIGCGVTHDALPEYLHLDWSDFDDRLTLERYGGRRNVHIGLKSMRIVAASPCSLPTCSSSALAPREVTDVTG